MAFVVLRPESSVALGELLNYCESEISERAAIPKRIEIISTMPMTAVGKIFRPLLREQISATILREHLQHQGIAADISCKADNKLGMTAFVKLADHSTRNKVSELLSTYNIVVTYLP